jgi:hypothetical protein
MAKVLVVVSFMDFGGMYTPNKWRKSLHSRVSNALYLFFSTRARRPRFSQQQQE